MGLDHLGARLDGAPQLTRIPLGGCHNIMPAKDRRDDALGKVIATRQLVVNRSPKSRVLLRIGRPRRHSKGGWICHFRLTGAGKQRLRYACGEDPVQALQLVLVAIRLEVQQFRPTISWLGLSPTMAFPRQVPAIDPKLVLRLDRLIDRELARWAADAKRRWLRTRKRSRLTSA